MHDEQSSKVSMEHGIVEPEAQAQVVQVMAVVQARTAENAPWTDEGKVGVPTPDVLEKAARKYLRLYRMNHPNKESRVVKRTVLHRDEILEG